ncbi:MAG: non-homologous end-joining DNA ligase [Micromonosporaceae bacterium]|nr:non-homologous end-joining DNA ligase [Micromonosporaceae bacterium]
MPEQRVRVAIGGRELELSNLDKVLYPEVGFTKGEIIDYYVRVADVLLPHLADRPLTRVRYPNGVDGGSFFEKNKPAGTPPWVRTQRLPVPGSASGRETLDFVVVDSVAALVWLANLAAIELHTPQWRLVDGRPGNPDLLVVDLDPGPGTGLPECCLVAVAARQRLEHDGLTPLAKTSGRKGMQLLARLDGTRTSDEVTAYAKQVAEDLATALPDLVTARMAKHLRPGKIFVDWSQNSAAKTTIAPYSLRAAPTPTVSAPVDWSEVERGTVRPLEAGEVLDRLNRHGDPLAVLLS